MIRKAQAGLCRTEAKPLNQVPEKKVTMDFLKYVNSRDIREHLREIAHQFIACGKG